MSKVVVVGSSNLDFTVAVDHLPAAGETVSGGEFYQSFGGKGANQAVAALKAGADVLFLTKVGADAQGRRIREHLSSLGLPLETLLHDATRHTGIALIVVDHTGRNLIAVAPGSNRTLTVEEVRRASPLLSQGAVLLAQLEIPLPVVQEALTIGKAQQMLTIVNPAPARPCPAEFLKFVDILTPNETEAQVLTGLADPEAAGRSAEGKADVQPALCARGIGSVLITLGERGTLLVGKGQSRRFPTYPVQPVDTTAAGDAFNGALACALAEGQTLDVAVPFANAAGALATTKRGAQDSLPVRSAIKELAGGKG